MRFAPHYPANVPDLRDFGEWIRSPKFRTTGVAGARTVSRVLVFVWELIIVCTTSPVTDRETAMPVFPSDNGPDFPWTEADAMYLVLVRYAADLVKGGPGSREDEQLDRVRNAMEAYEAKRWLRSIRPPPWAA
jgi:hypothetical protein